MRILVAHNYYLNRGGEDVVFEAETALLRQYGHEVYSWEEHNERAQEQTVIGAAAGAVWSFASQKRMAELIRQHRPEVVHFHNTFLRISPAVYYTCQKAGVPVVKTLHKFRNLSPAASFLRDGKVCEDCLGSTGLWPSVQHGCWRGSRSQTAVVATMLTTHRWLKTWQNQVNLFVVLTEFAREKLVANGLPQEKVVVKPNFVTSSPVQLVSKPPASAPFALFVGRLSPEKGPDLLVKAWENLSQIPLKVVGDGPMRQELEQAARQFSHDQIEFCGTSSHEDVLALMQQARFLVISSNCYEGLPMAIIEAFSRQLPVIAPRLGSMNGIVRHDENGLHFKAHDAADLAHWVKWAWEHPDEMDTLAVNAYREYQEKYSASSNYQQLMEIYQRAITSVGS
jgi:glycosyltransferase involved in cell wall biosynthesis